MPKVRVGIQRAIHEFVCKSSNCSIGCGHRSHSDNRKIWIHCPSCNGRAFALFDDDLLPQVWCEKNCHDAFYKFYKLAGIKPEYKHSPWRLMEPELYKFFQVGEFENG